MQKLTEHRKLSPALCYRASAGSCSLFTAQTLEMSAVVVFAKEGGVCASHLTPSLINKSYSECSASPILILVKVIDCGHTSSLDVTILIILPSKINDSGPRLNV